ncbi:MAG: hypothetical protein JO369_06070 [Paucibacter sp.]|nr:hypothetical protein [Roseateles sp.]
MTTSTDTLPPASPPDLAGLRAQLQALLQWQARHAGPAAPALDRADPAAALSHFARTHGARWEGEQLKLWQRVEAALVRQLGAQTAYPLHGSLAPFDALDNGHAPRQGGPVGLDLAALLRHPACVLDEADELDLLIRYWEAARRALPDVDLDFGNFWRDFEWAALAWHLDRIATEAAPDRRLLAHVVRTATRYIELKPLTLLIDAEGLLADGFTLR